MRLRHLAPFIVLFAWQSAPLPVPDDSLPRVRLRLGGGSSAFAYSYWGIAGGECLQPGSGCDCTSYAPTYSKLYDQDETAATAGILADAWAGPDLRISAAYATVERSDVGLRQRPLMAAVAREGPSLGFGAGWAFSAPRVGYDGPSAYLRAGPLGKAHLRAELRPPTATPGVGGWARVGLGYNQGRAGGSAIFVGLAAVEAGADTSYQAMPQAPATRTRPAFSFELSIPVKRRFDLFVAGHVAEHAHAIGVGMDLRFR